MANDVLVLIFQLIVLLFSVIIHEVSHGAVANRLGDNTAKAAGRLTLNPVKHLDFFGSILLPLTLFIIKSPVLFGWAKPVPFNPFNLKNPKRDGGLIAIAGPVSNFSIAIVFGLILRFFTGLTPALTIFFSLIVIINIALGIFNLVPIPPLDGSKVLFAVLPRGSAEFQMKIERYGFFILLFFIFFGFQYLAPLIYGIYNFIVGPGAGLI